MLVISTPRHVEFIGLCLEELLVEQFNVPTYLFLFAFYLSTLY